MGGLRSGFLLNLGTLLGHHKGTEMVELVSVSIGSREEGGEVAHFRGCNCFAARTEAGGGLSVQRSQINLEGLFQRLPFVL